MSGRQIGALLYFLLLHVPMLCPSSVAGLLVSFTWHYLFFLSFLSFAGLGVSHFNKGLDSMKPELILVVNQKN